MSAFVVAAVVASDGPAPHNVPETQFIRKSGTFGNKKCATSKHCRICHERAHLLSNLLLAEFTIKPTLIVKSTPTWCSTPAAFKARGFAAVGKDRRNGIRTPGRDYEERSGPSACYGDVMAPALLRALPAEGYTYGAATHAHASGQCSRPMLDDLRAPTTRRRKQQT